MLPVRKNREIALLGSCFRTPLRSTRPESITAAIEQKLRLAALLKAYQLLERGSITETARTPDARWMRAVSFAFRFGEENGARLLFLRRQR